MSHPPQPRITALDFPPLQMSGNNYLTWVQNAQSNLTANNLEQAILDNPDVEQSIYTKARAIVYLRRHLDASLIDQYLAINDPKSSLESIERQIRSSDDNHVACYESGISELKVPRFQIRSGIQYCVIPNRFEVATLRGGNPRI